MKNILKLLLLSGVIVFATFSCEKEEAPKLSDFTEGYITGSFICDKMDSEGQSIGKKTERAYCILLDSSKNTDPLRRMNFYTLNLPSDIFEFPPTIISVLYNGGNCGPAFFPDSIRTKYKIKFQYRILNNDEKEQFSCGACTADRPSFLWENYNQATLKNITKIDQ